MTNKSGKNYVVANWKMNLLAADSGRLAQAFKERASNLKKTKVWIGASSTAIPHTAEVLKGSNVKLGAQNVYSPEGAFTGEVSIAMLREFGCTFAIVGHSERRHVFGETDSLIVKRATLGLEANFGIIFCIGEKLDEREAGQTEAVLERQTAPLINAIKDLDQQNLLIAYEPVWAIGTGKVATIAEVDAAHSFIQKLWSEKLWSDRAKRPCPPILYGGSVTSDNFASIIALDSVSGALVGGASLSKEKFLPLVEISEAS